MAHSAPDAQRAHDATVDADDADDPGAARPAAAPAPAAWHAQVAAARRGDRHAFAQLHARFCRMVHGVLLSYVPPVDANDLVQDVFLSAMQKLTDLRDDGAFGGWLAQLARSRAVDHLRRAGARASFDPLPPGSVASPHQRQEVQEVLAAIRSLPEAYREPLVLRLVEGLTGPEIAEETGLTEGSVRVNLHRGMKLLREKLGGGHG